MYINWAHHYIPKIGGFGSLIVNFIFMYILKDDQMNKLGNYRYLLLSFAIYNLISTAGDVMVPLLVHDYRYAFSIFIVDGIFEKKSVIGGIMVCFRCGLVSVSYAILHSHFVYRYLTLFANNFLIRWFLPYGLTLTVTYCILIFTAWFSACYFFFFSDIERTAYLQESINATYHADAFDLNMLSSLYFEASAQTIRDSWIAIGIVTWISTFSTCIYGILGVLIVKKLKTQHLFMSKATLRMQHQLMLALAIQAVIPVFVSFLPCLLVLYQPVFMLNVGNWLCVTASIAIGLFPVLDPLALLYVIPTFRRRIREIFATVLAYLSGSAGNPGSTIVFSHVARESKW